MNRKLLVTLLRKNIDELGMITEGFLEMDEYPTSLIQLAKRKTEDIQMIIDEIATNTVVGEPKKPIEEVVEVVEIEKVAELADSADIAEETATNEIVEIVETEETVETVETEEIKEETEITEIVEPEIVEPEIVEPEIVEPEIVEPEIVEPEIVEPEIVEPEIVELEIIEPKIIEPEILADSDKTEAQSIDTNIQIADVVEIVLDEIDALVKKESLLEKESYTETVVSEAKIHVEEQKKVTIADRMGNQTATRNEKLSHVDNSISASIANKKISDIKQAISIGDRFRFQRELFKSNGEDMNKTLTYLNQLATLDEAMSFLKSKYGWENSNEAVEDFYQIIKRKFV